MFFLGLRVSEEYTQGWMQRPQYRNAIPEQWNNFFCREAQRSSTCFYMWTVVDHSGKRLLYDCKSRDIVKPLYQHLIERFTREGGNIKELNASSFNHQRTIHRTRSSHTCCRAPKVDQLSQAQNGC